MIYYINTNTASGKKTYSNSSHIALAEPHFGLHYYIKPHPEMTMAIFIDLKKAFDTSSYDVLVHKLYKYGIKGVANNWLLHYLTARKQYVLHGDTSSHTELI